MRNNVFFIVCIFLLAACTKDDSEITKKDTVVVKKDLYFLSKITSNDIVDKTSWICDFVYDDQNHLVNYNEKSVIENSERANVIVWKDNKVVNISGEISEAESGEMVKTSYNHEASYVGDNVVKVKSYRLNNGLKSDQIISYEYDSNNNISKFTRLDKESEKDPSYGEFVCSFKYNKDGNMISFNDIDINAKYDDIDNPYMLTGLPIPLCISIYNNFYENNISKNNCLEYTKHNFDSEESDPKTKKITCNNKYEDGRLIETSYMCDGKIIKSFKYEYIKAK